MIPVATRLDPGPGTEFERIATAMNLTTYELAKRVLTRWVETYPAEES